MKKSKKEESYELTPKGFMTQHVVAYDDFENALVRYMGRINCNAIVYDNDTLSFVKVEKGK